MKNRLLTLFAFILISVLSVYAQGGHTVSGVVLTEQGEPLVGVTIQYKNDPTKGIITDLDGNFVLQNVPANTTLVFSYIGFKDYTLLVTKDMTRQTIALKEDVNQTEEVVVIGRGTQRKISVRNKCKK